ncbi:TPA: 50S ribosomal protein L28 [bacterium]|nr:MAG: 50S ribosomal protein L28 [Candidatus Hydrogenedentes bacterium CG1_02_42_14]PIU47626.1 MAG: 50S ribosomal protein L28 [Candidatus Hydrogenedentes bacterium CG07_land_8_20_14_0_80_42_17]HBW47686.1 50S ribosomal protein L28 [bacterium]
MATAICEICGKKYGTGNNVSHSNHKTHRQWRANLQKIQVKLANGGVVSAKVCTRCIKSNRIAKA